MSNGQTVNASLSPYNPFKDVAMSMMEEAPSMYLGSLENDPTSSIAVTGCPDQGEDVQITLASMGIRGSYSIKSSGEMKNSNLPFKREREAWP